MYCTVNNIPFNSLAAVNYLNRYNSSTQHIANILLLLLILSLICWPQPVEHTKNTFLGRCSGCILLEPANTSTLQMCSTALCNNFMEFSHKIEHLHNKRLSLCNAALSLLHINILQFAYQTMTDVTSIIENQYPYPIDYIPLKPVKSVLFPHSLLSTFI